MDYNKIQILIEKYWAGETSLEEEQAIRLYFQSENVDKRLLKYQSWFQFIREEQSVKMDKKISLPQTVVRHIKRVPTWKKYAMAACMIIAIGLTIWWSNTSTDSGTYANNVYEVEDSKEAYEVTKSALLLVSSKMNKGASKAAQKIKQVNTIQKFMKKKK